jgi:transposase
MAAQFVQIDRNTPMLMPPDLRDWVPGDDLVHFVIEAVDRLPQGIFQVNHRGTGSKQYPPHTMLALLIYCYANSIFSSRKIERATTRDVAVKYLTGGHKIDHDTICTFRRNNFEAITEAFVDVLEIAKELKLLKLGNIAIDGTHIKANASIDQNVTYKRAVEIREQLKLDIAGLMEEAEKADQDEVDTQKLPDEIARREKLAEKMDLAIEELRKRSAVRDAKAKAEYDEKLEKRQRQEKETGKKPKGREPKEPEYGPENSDEQCNLTDPDARIMRKNKRAGYTESYNAQAAVDTEGTQLIVGEHVSQSAADSNQLEPGVECIDERVGKPDSASTDAGYVNADMIERVEQELGIEVYCSVHREDAHSERNYDYRPPKATDRKPKTVKDPRLVEMRDKLRTPDGKDIYGRRNHTVETAFGIIKEVLGFRGFLLRGIEKVKGEWTLVCLSYNMKRLHNLINAT